MIEIDVRVALVARTALADRVKDWQRLNFPAESIAVQQTALSKLDDALAAEFVDHLQAPTSRADGEPRSAFSDALPSVTDVTDHSATDRANR